jgi:polar amino acid transport system substrate-binding protein
MRLERLHRRHRWLGGLLGTVLILQGASAEARTLRIGTKVVTPFITFQNTGVYGFSANFWQQIAELNNWKYTWVRYPDMPSLLKAVEEGEVDGAIAAITITSERAQSVNFSLPYYRSGLQIVVRRQAGNPAEIAVSYLFSLNTLKGLAIVLILALASAHLIWLAERNNNPDMFPRNYKDGIREALWWSLVTATTVGYGDKYPTETIGRVLAIAWMLGGVIAISSFTASVTSASITSPVRNPQDLFGKAVGTVGGTTAELFLMRYPVRIQPFKTIPLAYQALRQGKIEAFVYDAPTIRFDAARDPDLQIVGQLLDPQDYGIAFTKTGSFQESMQAKVNVSLLQLQEQGYLEQLERKWLLSIGSD